MNQFAGRTIIGGDPNGSFAYLYYKVIGDGHCFINCYLEAMSETYQNETNRETRAKIARKMRLDFANFLLSESSKSSESISVRLNIINPNIMCNLLKFRDPDQSSITDLEYIKSQYNQNEPHSEDFIYGLILSYRFVSPATGEDLTYDEIKFLYETDHRINVAKAENISTGGKTPYNPEIFGVGKIPINIGYYELTDGVGTGYQELMTSINTLLHPTEFLTHIESSLFAAYIGINAVIFPLGVYYKNHYRLIEHIQGAPELIMVNLNNIHWNLVSFKRNGDEQLLSIGIPEKAKDALFNNLTRLYSEGKL